jgi:GT2 family glycosyltransferase
VDVSVIIVHYNTPDLTRQCIESIIEKTEGIDYEIIVVDNASTVHDAAELGEAFPAIRLIKSGQNLGFAGGNNLGIKFAKGKYILLLNSDTVLINNAIALSFRYMEGHRKAGVVSAQLLYPDGRVQSVCQRFPSITYSLVELFRIQKFLSKEQRGKLLLGSFFDHQSSAKADWVWGTFFMFPRHLLESLPGKRLDDRYFMYAEDMQWCLDIRKLGYEIHYFPDAKVYHYMGGSSANRSTLMLQNNEKFLTDNFPALKLKILRVIQKVLTADEN